MARHEVIVGVVVSHIISLCWLISESQGSVI